MKMTNKSLVGSCEVTINTALKRLSKLSGKNKSALYSEFREWIDAIETGNRSYDILYLNTIRKNDI